jgi:peptidyl-prolyl cis-trans isomerase C
MKIKSLRLLLLVAAALPVCSAFGATASNTNATAPRTDALAELFGDPLIAKGEGLEIKRSELDKLVVDVKSAAAARGQQIPPQYLKEVLEPQLLARLIHIKILLNKATPEDRAAGKERADKQIEQVTKQVSEERLHLQLKAMGVTREEFVSKVTDEATSQAVAERELNVVISDEEAKEYFAEHPSQFEEPEKVHVSHILLGTRNPTNNMPLSDERKMARRKEIDGLLKRARAGEDFAKLAEEYSEDPGSKDKGGEYTFTRGQMVPEFEAAAFALDTNQISDVVTTAYGYHIIKSIEKIPAKKLAFKDVETNLKEALKQQAMMKKLPDYMNEARKAAKVEILDEKLVIKEPVAEATEEPALPVKPAQKPASAN